MNHRYQPQTSDISTKLYWTFFWGIVLGTALGYGVRGIVDGKDIPPPDEKIAMKMENEAVSPTPVEAAAPAEPAETEPTETNPTTPEPEVDTPVEPAVRKPFDPDVKGLWPGRHVFVGIEGTIASLETLEWLYEFRPGGIILGPENVSDPLQLGALVLQLKEAVGLGTTINDPPFIIYQDDTRALPAIATTLEMTGASNADGKPSALAQARAARAHGIGVVFAPSLDIYLSGISAPDLQKISLGSQPSEVVELGLAYIDEMRSGGVLPVVSHFPGAGLAVPQEKGMWHIPAAQMDGMAAGMQPFQEAISAGVPGLLVGHMAVPGIETDDPNRMASSSPKLLKILLRERMKFEGVVIADDLGRAPTTQEDTLDRIAVTALVNGCDAVVLKDANREKLSEICGALVRVSRRNDFPTAQLQASKARLDTWQKALAASPPAPAAPDNVNTDDKTIVAANTVSTKVDMGAIAAAKAADKTAEATQDEKTPPALPDTGKATENVDDEVKEDLVVIAPPTDAPVEVKKPEEAEGGPKMDAPADEKKPADTKADAPTEVKKPEETTEAAKADAPAEEKKPEEIKEAAKADKPAEEKKPEVGEDDSKPIEAMETGEPTAVVVEGPFLEHSIEKGDTLIELAKRYNVSVADLNAWNKLDESQTIKYGYKLKVRPLTRDAVNADSSGEDPDEKKGDEPDGASGAAPAEVPIQVVTTDTPEEKSTPGESMATEVKVLDVELPPEPEALESITPVEAPEAADSKPDETVAMDTDDESAPAKAPDVTPDSPNSDALAGSDPEEKAPATAPESAKKRTPQPADTDKRNHAVKAGDTVDSVAGQYGVTPSELVAWNGLEGPGATLATSSTIVVYLPVAATTDEVEVEDGDASNPDDYVIHEVKAGDNLRRIANQYGVSQKRIVEFNKLKDPDHVQLGWKLKIPK